MHDRKESEKNTSIRPEDLDKIIGQEPINSMVNSPSLTFSESKQEFNNVSNLLIGIEKDIEESDKKVIMKLLKNIKNKLKKIKEYFEANPFGTQLEFLKEETTNHNIENDLRIEKLRKSIQSLEKKMDGKNEGFETSIKQLWQMTAELSKTLETHQQTIDALFKEPKRHVRLSDSKMDGSMEERISTVETILRHLKDQLDIVSSTVASVEMEMRHTRTFPTTSQKMTSKNNDTQIVLEVIGVEVEHLKKTVQEIKDNVHVKLYKLESKLDKNLKEKEAVGLGADTGMSKDKSTTASSNSEMISTSALGNKLEKLEQENKELKARLAVLEAYVFAPKQGNTKAIEGGNNTPNQSSTSFFSTSTSSSVKSTHLYLDNEEKYNDGASESKYNSLETSMPKSN